MFEAEETEYRQAQKPESMLSHGAGYGVCRNIRRVTLHRNSHRSIRYLYELNRKHFLIMESISSTLWCLRVGAGRR